MFITEVSDADASFRVNPDDLLVVNDEKECILRIMREDSKVLLENRLHTYKFNVIYKKQDEKKLILTSARENNRARQGTFECNSINKFSLCGKIGFA